MHRPGSGRVPGRAVALETPRRFDRAAILSVAVFVLLPVEVVTGYVALVHHMGVFALDFHYAFWHTGRDVLHGNFAYPTDLGATADPFVYPPLTAILFAPFAILPLTAAEWVFTALGIVCVGVALRAFGVKDWRCYGAAFLWPPVLSAIQAGNITLLLLGGIGLAWAFRARAPVAGLLVAVLVSTKLFLWPLGLWLLATRRFRAAAWAAGLFVALNSLAWKVVEAGSVGSYLGLLHRISAGEGWDTYTMRVLAARMGVPAAAGITLTGLAIALVGVAWWKHGRGDDRMTLAAAVLIALISSPIVWLHYLALLLVPVALMRRSLGLIWLLPLVTIDLPGKGSGGLVQTAMGVGIIAAVAVTVFWRPLSFLQSEQPAAGPA